MKIAWVLGWAVPQSWFASVATAALPRADHIYVPASAGAVAHLEADGPFDHVVGYSLGSQLLLSAADRIGRLGKVALLAPIFAFSAEESLGGRASRTQVRQLARWLAREPSAALRDFYSRAQLDVPESHTPADGLEELQWGLIRLANGRVEPPLPATWQAWCGADDPLLDARKLRAIEPRIRVVEGANHHPRPLIEAFAGGIA